MFVTFLEENKSYVNPKNAKSPTSEYSYCHTAR